VALLLPARMRLAERLGWVAAALSVVAGNYVVKVDLLHADFFAGAAGVDVKPTPSSIVGFMRDGAASLVGYDLGPSFLTGADARTLGLLPYLLTAIFVVCAAALAVGAVVGDARGGGRRLRPWLLGPALLVALLLVASISIRLEQRWLYVPQVVLLLGLAWLAGRWRWGALGAGRCAIARPAGALLVTALLASTAADLVYARHVQDVYFMTGQRMADSVLDRVVRQHRLELPKATVFLLSDDPVFRDWYLAGGWFFRFYAPGSNPDVRFVHDATAIQSARDVRPQRLAFRVEVDQVVEVPLAPPTSGRAPTAPRRRAGG
jgi:hypothetical protein